MAPAKKLAFFNAIGGRRQGLPARDADEIQNSMGSNAAPWGAPPFLLGGEQFGLVPFQLGLSTTRIKQKLNPRWSQQAGFSHDKLEQH